MGLRPNEKSSHPALGMATSSLLANSDLDSEKGIWQRPFPFPGADYLTIQDMSPHTAIVGSTGAGKTILLKHFMAAVLPASLDEGGLTFRSVVYDPKRELYPFLTGLGIPEQQIIVTHPFDARSASWNIAADFVEPAQIEELVEIIVPTEENRMSDASGEFFANTSRIIFQDVIKGLATVRPANWELLDVVECVSNRNALKAVLKKTKTGGDSWNTYLRPLELDGEDKTALSILASLLTYIRPFESLAALWQHADKKFSLSEWHIGSGVILLGADPSRERTLQRVNQLLMRRSSQMLLSRDDDRPVDLTWFFLDEVREAGKLRGLRQLLTEGRSKGARVVLGFQDIEGLYSLYDEHESEEMIGLCANRLVLHLDNPRTRRWASEFFGEEEVLQESQSHGISAGTGSGSVSRGTQTNIGMRTNVLPIELHNLPLGNPDDGIQLFFAIPGRRNKHLFPPKLAQYAISHEKKSSLKAFKERPASHQTPRYWTKEDRDLLGLKQQNRKRRKRQQNTYRQHSNNVITGEL